MGSGMKLSVEQPLKGIDVLCPIYDCLHLVFKIYRKYWFISPVKIWTLTGAYSKSSSL